MPPRPKSGKNKGGGGAGSKDARKRSAAAADAFERFYGDQYAERWPALRAALMQPTSFAALLNRYADQAALAQSLAGLPGLTRVEGVELPCVVQTAPEQQAPTAEESGGAENDNASPSGSRDSNAAGVKTSAALLRFPPPPRDDRFLTVYYPLDPSSLLAVQALQLQPDDSVLDLCAAPGGKSLAILQYLHGGAGRLTCNDPAPDRRRRLTQVIQDYIPESDRGRVTITGYDGTRGWHGHGLDSDFDKVLLDAPCSTERHVMHKPSELALWRPGRSKSNAERQVGLLHTALDALRPAGLLVYSTCSLSELENDNVLDRVLSKRSDREALEVLRPSFAFGESTRHGWMILPDQTSFGPLFIALMTRK